MTELLSDEALQELRDALEEPFDPVEETMTTTTSSSLSVEWPSTIQQKKRFEKYFEMCGSVFSIVFENHATNEGKLCPPQGFVTSMMDTRTFRFDVVDRHMFRGMYVVEVPQNFKVPETAKDQLSPGGWIRLFAKGTSTLLAVYSGLSDKHYLEFRKYALKHHEKTPYKELKLEDFREMARAHRKGLIEDVYSKDGIDVITDDLKPYTRISNNQMIRTSGAVDIGPDMFSMCDGKLQKVTCATMPECLNCIPFFRTSVDSVGVESEYEETFRLDADRNEYDIDVRNPITGRYSSFYRCTFTHN